MRRPGLRHGRLRRGDAPAGRDGQSGRQCRPIGRPARTNAGRAQPCATRRRQCSGAPAASRWKAPGTLL